MVEFEIFDSAYIIGGSLVVYLKIFKFDFFYKVPLKEQFLNLSLWAMQVTWSI